MADEIDLANEQSERWLNQAIAQTLTTGQRLVPRGSCYYCETDFKEGDKRLFCDIECSKAYETEERLKNRR